MVYIDKFLNVYWGISKRYYTGCPINSFPVYKFITVDRIGIAEFGLRKCYSNALSSFVKRKPVFVYTFTNIERCRQLCGMQ